MWKILSFVAAAGWACVAQAECTGTDLLAAMPPEKRADLAQAAARVPYPEGLIWRAEKGDHVIHIVGTLHSADPRHVDTLAQIKPLIARAGTVFLELGEGDEARMQALMARDPGLAFIVEGPTLPQLLDPPEWQVLKRAMADRGVPGFMAAKMKPWMAMMTMGLSKCVFQQTLRGERGLDHLIMEHAATIGNPSKALEPYDTAARLFDSYTDAEMMEFLRLTIAMEATMDPDAQHATMTEAYFREEVRILWELGIHQTLANPQGYAPAEIMAEFDRLEEVLIFKRNRAWMDRIYDAAATGEVFVAAGALHLPGSDGVLQLLENEGYRLLRIPRDR